MKLRHTLHNLLPAVLLLFILASGLFHPASAASQAGQPVTLETARIDIWPEYDQPSVLVIDTLTLSSSTSLPAALKVRIPAAAGKPAAVAMQDVAGLYNLNFTYNRAGDWIEVSFTTPVPEVRIEYYDPSLKKNGNQRSFTYRWPADYTAMDLTVKIMQPLNASKMTFRPDIGGGKKENDGLTYFTLTAGEVKTGLTFDLSMTYVKPDDTLTNAQVYQTARPNEPVDSNTPGRVNLFLNITRNPLLLVLVAAGLLLFITGGLIWFWQIGILHFERADGPALGRRRHGGRGLASGKETSGGRGAAGSRATSPAMVAEGEGASEEIFCHHCGKRAAAGDAFCRACGTKLRQ